MSIASRASFSDDSRKLKHILPKSLLLRDYLLDDMSSCSSNGFRSYPRRQCCTTVRFLIETDLNKNHKMFSKPHRTSNIKPPKQSSILQKASEVMIKAFKRLPFVDARVSTKAKLLPRSLSRKLLKRGFWNKTDQPNNKTKRLTTFADLIKQDDVVTPLPLPSPLRLSTAVTVEIRSLTSNNDSWSATTESLTTTVNSSEVNLAQNDVADELHEKMKRTDGNRVGVTTVTATVNNYSDATENAKKWQDNQDEQFSPVSVMDFPSDSDVDEEDEVSSTSPHKHLNVKGAKISTHKTRISDRVPQLEPVKLEDRIAQSVLESSTTTFHDVVQEENQVEKKATALLHLLKSTVSSHHLLKYEAVECLLLEFLKESTLEENVSDYEVLQRAKDWMDGQEEQDIFIDWECENNRKTYLREMEKGVKWSNYDHQVEKVNVGLEVECEIFNSLVNDVLTDFHLQEFDHED
ncbi:uncharacterized protein LOC110867784 [Helianthus annuus]|uniref:DUF4378 domain-containing protein n=1 Tax=Helianthus annuus TaxID=4232 RepID=A0A251UAY7_HELAN|nr:uncharacterized protein LOC110867784 [Helianthus annuus]